MGNLKWLGGTAPILDNCVPADWLDGYGLTMSNQATLEDTDGDGAPNWHEFITGTDPTNGRSLFQVCPKLTGSNLVLEWTPIAGRIYDIEFTPDLGLATPWSIYQANVPFTLGIDTAITIPTSGSPRGFYRVAVRQ